MSNPYAAPLGGRDPVEALKTSRDEYRALVPRVTAGQWKQPWAPGKWTLEQILLHVAQWEMILGVRVRAAVGTPDYTVQPLEQDDLMAVEGPVVDAAAAFAAFDAVRGLNLALALSLSAAQRRTAVRHPGRGLIDVEDLLVTLAGHGIHHLKQLQGAMRIDGRA